MQKPLDPVLFDWPSDNPALRGSTCADCGATTFPVATRCPKCGSKSVETVDLPTSGTVVTWTTQGFPPSIPYAGDETGRNFEPFGVALVQLGDVVRVEGKLTVSDPDQMDFGMPVELQIIPFYTDTDGDEIMTFAFKPTKESA